MAGNNFKIKAARPVQELVTHCNAIRVPWRWPENNCFGEHLQALAVPDTSIWRGTLHRKMVAAYVLQYRTKIVREASGIVANTAYLSSSSSSFTFSESFGEHGVHLRRPQHASHFTEKQCLDAVSVKRLFEVCYQIRCKSMEIWISIVFVEDVSWGG